MAYVILAHFAYVNLAAPKFRINLTKYRHGPTTPHVRDDKVDVRRGRGRGQNLMEQKHTPARIRVSASNILDATMHVPWARAT